MIIEGLILIALLAVLLGGLLAGSKPYDDIDPQSLAVPSAKLIRAAADAPVASRRSVRDARRLTPIVDRRPSALVLRQDGLADGLAVEGPLDPGDAAIRLLRAVEGGLRRGRQRGEGRRP